MANPNPTMIMVFFFFFLLFNVISPVLCSTNVLFSGDKLYSSEKLVYGDYSLVMQSDCNLVTYANDTRIWDTNTESWFFKDDCYLSQESNGELILYGYLLKQPSFNITVVLWRSGVKSSTGSYALVLKYDGSIHVYGPSLWSSSNTNSNSNSNSIMTDHYSASLWSSNSDSITIDSTLWSGDVAPIGTIIARNHYKLELLDSCNMTLSNVKTKEVLWYTNKTDSLTLRDCFVNIEGNGELKVKYSGGATLWSNGAQGPSPGEYVLVLRSDGKLVVYGPSIWSNLIKSGSGFGEKIAMVTQV